LNGIKIKRKNLKNKLAQEDQQEVHQQELAQEEQQETKCKLWQSNRKEKNLAAGKVTKLKVKRNHLVENVIKTEKSKWLTTVLKLKRKNEIMENCPFCSGNAGCC